MCECARARCHERIKPSAISFDSISRVRRIYIGGENCVSNSCRLPPYTYLPTYLPTYLLTCTRSRYPVRRVNKATTPRAQPASASEAHSVILELFHPPPTARRAQCAPFASLPSPLFPPLSHTNSLGGYFGGSAECQVFFRGEKRDNSYGALYVSGSAGSFVSALEPAPSIVPFEILIAFRALAPRTGRRPVRSLPPHESISWKLAVYHLKLRNRVFESREFISTRPLRTPSSPRRAKGSSQMASNRAK